MKYYSSGDGEGGGGGKDKPPVAPKNYTPLTSDQRKDWNDFLMYLDKKGVGGNAKLDARDQSLGLGYLKEYQKANPKTTVTQELIPSVQYDQYQIRKGEGGFNGLTPEQMKYIRKGLNPAYLARETSPVDGWLGSITSKSYYPRGYRSDNQGNQYDFGTDMESYVRGLSDPTVNENFRIKTK